MKTSSKECIGITEHKKINGMRYDLKQNLAPFITLDVLITVDASGATLSINDETRQFTIPLEPILEYIESVKEKRFKNGKNQIKGTN